MATAGSSYADFNVDPATGLKRRIMQSLPGGWGADPTAPDAPSGGGLPGGDTTAPFFVPPALGDPSAPTPKVGPGGIVQSSPTEGLPPAGSPAGAPVPGPVNYAMAGGMAAPSSTSNAPTVQAPTVAKTTLDPTPVGIDGPPGFQPGHQQDNFPDGFPGTTQNNSAAGGAPNYDAINGFYQKYLGRAASQDEAANWINGTYGATDLAGIEKQISQSGEASDYQKNHGGAPSGGSGSGDPGAFLLQLLQSGMDREQAIAQTSQKFGLQQGQDGYPLYYANNNTIGLKGSYLANVNGQWNQVQRGPEGGSGAPAAAGSPANDTYSKFLEQLMNDRNASAAQRDQVRQMIMDRLKLAGQPVNENDIGISQPLSAARDEVQRSQQTERTALAERLYAQGGGGLQSGALTQQIQQSAERNAGGLSQLRAGLITSQIQQKQQEMQSLLQMALASGDTQSAQLLQAQIAALSAQVNREGMGINLAEFLANLNKGTVSAGAGG